MTDILNRPLKKQGISDRKQLLNYPNVGNGFEAFIIEEIIKGLQAIEVTNWNYFYFRTRNGSEVGLILEGPFGTLPVEVKFGSMVKQRHLRSIKNFVYQNNLPLGIVINNCECPELIVDRIVLVPAIWV